MENTKQVPFVHLHVHTEHSLLDGAARLLVGKDKSPLFDECKRLNMPGIAITDHGNIMGTFTAFSLLKKYNSDPEKPFNVIYGCEFYFVDDMKNQSMKEERYHIVILAKNDKGLKNIIKLTSLSYIDGYYYKPRIDINLLREYSEGLICLSACLAGVIPQKLLHNDYKGAKEHALLLQEVFGKEDFYIELQDHNIPEERQVLPLLAQLADEIGAKVVATNDVHYIKKEDAEMQDVMMCLQTGVKLDTEKRMKFSTDEFYLKSYEEMLELFSWREDALTNTIEILEKCKGVKFAVHQEEKLYPAYVAPDGMTPEEYLRKLTFEGLKRRYGEITEEISERVEKELKIIISKGFASYYLVVWDFINYAKSQDIPIGPGRGSGVGSIVAYAIGITNVEPLRYNLLFERFLNMERDSPPDFDVDICTERRGEVIDYVVKKYGRNRVCQILTLGKLKPKNAIKDVARVYNVPLDVVEKTIKFIPNVPGINFNRIFGKEIDKETGKPFPAISEFMEIYESNPQMHTVIDMALKLEDMPKNTSMHAAGVVICQSIVTDEVPVLTTKKKDKIDDVNVVTQFQKGELETLGVLKMDFLGLITLTDIHHAIKYVKEQHGVEIDFDKLGVDDPNVYDLISQGDTDLVFQLENGGMRNFMKNLKPRNIEDIIIGVSMYRPGPMDQIGALLEARANPEKIHYPAEQIKSILENTSGFFVYQEQVMNVARVMSDYTLGQAELLRRSMAKKDPKAMAKEGIRFKEGALKNGYDEKTIDSIFKQMEEFAKYAFNKSHAAAYSYLAYQTAYLRRYYSVEFFCSYLNNRITKSDQLLKYLNIAKKHNIEILPASINKSGPLFSVEKGKIRFGLTAIKNIGEQVAIEIAKEREKNGEYKSLTDFVDRLDVKIANKTTIENLTKAGAMDCLNQTRATIIANYPKIIAKVTGDHKNQATGQTSMFDFIPEEKEEKLAVYDEYDKLDKLAMEKEVLNTYISGHPLEEFVKELKSYEFNLSTISIFLAPKQEEGEDDENMVDEESEREKKDIINRYADKTIKLAGILDNFVAKKTKSGSTMATATITDLYDTINIIFFPKVYEQIKNFVKNDKVVEIEGILQFKDEGVSIAVNRCKDLQRGECQDKEVDTSHYIVYVKGDDGDTKEMISNKIFRMVGRNQVGNDELKIQHQDKMFNYPSRVKFDQVMMLMLEDIFGESYVKIAYTDGKKTEFIDKNQI